MDEWTNAELKRIGTAEELQIASLRRDGSLRNRRRSGSSASVMICTFDPHMVPPPPGFGALESRDLNLLLTDLLSDTGYRSTISQTTSFSWGNFGVTTTADCRSRQLLHL